MSSLYPQSFKDCATGIVFDRLEDVDGPSQYMMIHQTVSKISIATETSRRWVEEAKIDAGKKPGIPVNV